MPQAHEASLAGWGNHPRLRCAVRRPESQGALRRVLDTRGTLGRGLGRSYGDAALNDQGTVVDMTALDRYLAFDEARGELRVEAGASLRQIIEDFAPRGFFPRIVPGTKFVTVGGCIANDVHGKAHHVDGCFSESVVDFDLLLADGSVRRCSRDENAELFWATMGGMGLTGLVTAATLRLRRIETTYFHQKAIRVGNLEEMVAALDEHDRAHRYSVAWVDPMARGSRLGRGVLTVGDHATREDLPASKRGKALAVSPPSPLVVPLEMPSFALNSTTVRLLDVVIEQMQAGAGALAHYEKFFFPLDFVGEWWRGYGRQGFIQYQLVVPLDDGVARLRRLLERIGASDQVPFLNVLKKFGKANAAPLSFPFEGYTLAIDFPVRPGLRELTRDLDAQVLEAGGRLYLGKDSMLDAPTMAAMYPRLEEWRAVKKRVDPEGVFTSNLARRVGLA
ncbi:MAG: FAD-binding oxidoreductase [Myxococcota bacterium]